jgi:hypothetical protein
MRKFGIETPSVMTKEARRHMWLIGAACVAACVVSPHGIDNLLFPFSHLKMEAILLNTQEWLPALDPRLDGIYSQILFRIILVLTLASYILGARQAKLSHLMLTAIAGLLVLNGKRFTPDFVILNVPIMFFNLRQLAAKVSLTPGADSLRAWGNLLTVAILGALLMRTGIPATTKGGVAGEMGIGTTDRYAPVAMIDFLDRNGISGKVLNDMGLGGFLIFTRWPAEKVFIDGRTPIYGDDVYREFVDAMRTSQNFDELDRKYSFDYIVFKGDQIWDLRFFHKYLWHHPNWRLVYATHEGFVYVRNIPKFGKVIEMHSVKVNPLIVEMERAGERDIKDLVGK